MNERQQALEVKKWVGEYLAENGQVPTIEETERQFPTYNIKRLTVKVDGVQYSIAIGKQRIR